MSIIREIKDNYKIVSIVGLAKNVGKTVTLNYLINEAFHENTVIGITSTGRDGESSDLVTNTEKPTIHVSKDMLIATAKQALLMSDGKFEILDTTDFNTPMGKVVLVKVKEGGNVQIAGPSNTSDIKAVGEMLLNFGAEIVFIDGAIDRKAASSPVITDACVIATGAVLSRDIKKVVEKTAFSIECYRLDEVEEKIKQKIGGSSTICLINEEKEDIYIDVATGITAGKTITSKVDKHTTHIYVKGAVTPLLFKEIYQNKYAKQFIFVIDDPTKLFIESDMWNDAKKKGLRVQVLKTVKVVALTINPVSPQGYYFDSKEFHEKLNSYIQGVKILDVVSGGES